MAKPSRRSVTLTFLILVGFLLGSIAVQFGFIFFNGKSVPAPSISHDPVLLGSGQDLTFVVMGDSTSVGQGAPYTDSYAVAAAQHLADTHRVRFVNLGVSGARAYDVMKKQLPEATQYKPDVVLLAVGANDATHFTKHDSLKASLTSTIADLKKSNSSVRIIVTGCPEMGSVPRFATPTQWIMTRQTNQINAMYREMIQRDAAITFAPIADKTGPTFAQHPELFAQDKFHPNAKGYALWKPVIMQALDESFAENR